MTDPTPWLVLVLCIMATFVWRALGVGLATRIDPNGVLFQWFNCVAYAMLAGLITRILVFPVGTLAHSETVDRVAAMVIGFVIFFLTRRNVFTGTIAAFLLFLGLAYLRHSGRL